jgi:type I restriction enzyme S subunit
MTRSDSRELPAKWALTTLGEVFTWSSGGTPATSQKEFYGGGIPWLTSGELNDCSITECQASISQAGLENSAAKWVAPGSVMVALYGATVGKLGISEISMTTNQAVAFTNPQPVPAKFLFYYLLSQRTALIGQAQGAAQKNISQAILKAHPLVVPPLPEQRRIVAEIEKQFSRLDAGVAALKRVQANLKRYRAAVLQAACEGRLVPTEAELARAEGRAYESADVLLHRIVQERKLRWNAELGGDSRLPLPEGWSWANLSQISDIQGGIQKQPKRSPVENSFPFLRVANVLRGRLNLAEMHSVELFGNELQKLRLQTGDLLIVEGNGSPSEIGRMAVWDGSIADCVHQNHIIRARLLGAILAPYVQSYWNSPEGRRRVTDIASSTSGLHTLSVSKVARLWVPVPPLAEQHRIVSEVDRRLSVIAEIDAAITMNLKRADRLRQAILKRAFEGKLVAQDPSDEPASVLLERIRAERAASAGNGSSRVSGRKRTRATG